MELALGRFLGLGFVAEIVIQAINSLVNIRYSALYRRGLYPSGKAIFQMGQFNHKLFYNATETTVVGGARGGVGEIMGGLLDG